MRRAAAQEKVRSVKPKPIGIAQQKLLEILQQHAGVDAPRVMVLCEFPNMGKAELALQGLIQRGFARWEPGTRHNNVVYYITNEGRKHIKTT